MYSGIDAFHFRCRMPLNHPQRWTKGELQGEFLLGVFRYPWQALQQLQSFGEMTDRLMIGRALNRTLARTVPVGDGLRASICLRVVMRQQLGLPLCYLWELRFQHLRDVRVVALPLAPYEGVIRHLLGEDMLEGVYRGGAGRGLVEKLSSLQAPELIVHALLRYCGHGLQQRQSGVLADHCRRLEQAFSGRR